MRFLPFSRLVSLFAILSFAVPAAAQSDLTLSQTDAAAISGAGTTLNGAQNSTTAYRIVTAQDRSSLTVGAGATVSALRDFSGGNVVVTGGSLLELDTYFSSIAALSGGSVLSDSTLTYGGVNVFMNSTLNISGGTVQDSVHTLEAGTLNVSGGTLSGGVTARQASTITVTGGTLGGTQLLYDSSNTFNLRGGHVAEFFLIAGTLNVYGTGLAFVPDGSTSPGEGTLTGFLQQTDPATGLPYVLNAHVYNEGGQINLNPAPEPSAWVVLAVGVLSLTGLRLRARRRQSA